VNVVVGIPLYVMSAAALLAIVSGAFTLPGDLRRLPEWIGLLGVGITLITLIAMWDRPQSGFAGEIRLTHMSMLMSGIILGATLATNARHHVVLFRARSANEDVGLRDTGGLETSGHGHGGGGDVPCFHARVDLDQLFVDLAGELLLGPCHAQASAAASTTAAAAREDAPQLVPAAAMSI
jgi:hypothetical protein